MDVIDRTADPSGPMNYRLLADDEAWARAGEALRDFDPRRYLAVLKLVEEIVSIHRDPLAPAVAPSFYLFSKKNQDDLD